MQRTTAAVTLALFLLAIALPAPAAAHSVSRDYVACATSPGVPLPYGAPCGPIRLHESTFGSFVFVFADDNFQAPHIVLEDDGTWITATVYAVHLDMDTLQVKLGSTGTITLIH